MAPRQNPYSSAATNMLRMRLYRDESGLVVAGENTDAGKKTSGEILNRFIDEHLNQKMLEWNGIPLTTSTKHVHINLLQQTHHKGIDLR